MRRPLAAVCCVLAVLALGRLLGLAAPAQAMAIPESSRSRQAVAATAPVLRQAVERAGFAWGAPLFLRIIKEERVLEVWLRDGDRLRLFRSYAICSYSGDLGPKRREGDRQSPEGFYFVPPRRLNPASSFHLSFNLGFPNAYERGRGWTGSYLMVHGDCASIGCYAMGEDAGGFGGDDGAGADRNRPIEEIWTLANAAFHAGQPFFRVHIFPFRMTEAAMRRRAGSRWIGFWRNLKQGYDLFEATRQVPDVSVVDGRYAFRLPR